MVFRDRRHEFAVEQMKAELVSRVNHEFRTPITAVVGYGSMLGRPDLTPRHLREYGNNIVAAGQRLQRIFEILLLTAEARGWDPARDLETLDAQDVVEEAILLFASDREIRHQRPDPSEIPAIRGRRRALSMVVQELLDNAAKFSTAPDAIEVDIEPTTLRGKPAVAIAVADAGPGLADADRHGVFDAFSQADTSDQRSVGGLGIGLTVVRQVTNAHAGEVTLAPRPGGGTMVTLVLPGVEQSTTWSNRTIRR